jgi:hypothetical protein
MRSLNENNDFTFGVESQGRVQGASQDDSGFPAYQVDAARLAAPKT